MTHKERNTPAIQGLEIDRLLFSIDGRRNWISSKRGTTPAPRSKRAGCDSPPTNLSSFQLALNELS